MSITLIKPITFHSDVHWLDDLSNKISYGLFHSDSALPIPGLYSRNKIYRKSAIANLQLKLHFAQQK